MRIQMWNMGCRRWRFHALSPVVGLILLIAHGPAAPAAQTSHVVVQGVVRADSRPLRGARLTLTDARGEVAARFRTNQDGEFAVSLPEGSTYRLLARKAGYAPGHVQIRGIVADQRQVVVRLARGAALSGLVLDESGMPMAGLRVGVRPMSPADPAAASIDASAVSDDRGAYRIGSLPAGRYQVTLAETARVLRASPESSVLVLLSPDPAEPAGTRDGQDRLVDLDAGEEERLDIVRPGAQAGTGASAAGASTPSRETGAGSGITVRGRVFGPDRRPLRFASVRLQSASGWPPSQLARFDADGRYEFTFVPPGTYRILASADGMIDGVYESDRRTPNGHWIEVADGDRVDGFDIVLSRGAVIAGAVLDEFGEPLEGMSVHVWRAVVRDGRTELSAAVALPRLTDDLGRYRVHGLQPGTYYVAVSEQNEAVAAPAPAGVRFAMFSPAAPAPAPAEATVYYPGRASIRDAAPVQVDAGLDATGVDVQFTPPLGVRVTGVVLSSTGAPFSRSWVTLGVSRRSGSPRLPPWRAATGADGAFEFPHVPPGDYVLQADGGQSRFIGTPDGVVHLAESPLVHEFGSAPVAVADEDVGPLTLRMRPGSTVSGFLVQEGPGPQAANAAFTLSIVATDTDLAPGSLPGIRTNVDGTFEVSGLVGPVRVLPANVPGGGWWLKSVMIDGINAADDPVTFGTREQSKRNVEIVFSRVPTGLSGRVLDSGGQDPATGAAVVAFSVDPSRWFEGSRHLKRSISVDGRYTVAALPPGDYYVVAVDALETAQWQDPGVLQRLTPFAMFATVKEGQLIDMDLDLVRLP